jgi:hypothetical protein
MKAIAWTACGGHLHDGGKIFIPSGSYCVRHDYLNKGQIILNCLIQIENETNPSL